METDNKNPANSGGVLQYASRALGLVWTTNRSLTISYGLLTILGGLVPAAIALVGQLIIDAVVDSINNGAPIRPALTYIGIEAILVGVVAATQRGISMCQSLLRAQLGHRVNVLILDKAQQLSMAQFEDADFYDKLTRARREASSRPLSLVNRTFSLAQNGVTPGQLFHSPVPVFRVGRFDSVAGRISGVFRRDQVCR